MKFRSEFESHKKKIIPDQSDIEHVAASPCGNLRDTINCARLLETLEVNYGCVGFAGYV